jgi:histidyl-tRNA synthetase
MTVAPRTPPGVLELLPPQQLAFQRMLDTIRGGFERFGYLPVETPAFELTEMLLTKSGGETEKQVYFVQSTGALKQGDTPELALRFDLTVPLARYVAQHEAKLNFPFRRYQIQRVYRGERAQKGRYREFYQCDIDVVGKDTLALAFDAELPAIIFGIFAQLGFGDFTIFLNNRKLLRGLLDSLGLAEERHAAVLHEVDRLGKQALAEVRERLVTVVGVDGALADRLLELLTAHAGDSRATLAALAAFPSPTPVFTEGLAELTRVYEGTLALGVPARALRLNLAIVRGLDYYTGTVYETTLDASPQIGSICSGGRYENLASSYTKSKLPGVGISIGATRLFWQLREAGLISTAESSVEVLVGLMDEARLPDSLDVARQLRAAGICTEVQLEAKKIAKQFQYADRAGIRFMVLLGEDEAARGAVTVKDLRRQEQFEVPRAELAAALKVELEQQRALQGR